jgi:hypothetical protein
LRSSGTRPKLRALRRGATHEGGEAQSAAAGLAAVAAAGARPLHRAHAPRSPPLGAPHGFANPALYAQAGSSASRDVVPHPEVVGAVRNDYVNSVGSPNGQTFLSALAH